MHEISEIADVLKGYLNRIIAEKRAQQSRQRKDNGGEGIEIGVRQMDRLNHHRKRQEGVGAAREFDLSPEKSGERSYSHSIVPGGFEVMS